jgi:hypothetical protein
MGFKLNKYRKEVNLVFYACGGRRADWNFEEIQIGRGEK